MGACVSKSHDLGAAKGHAPRDGDRSASGATAGTPTDAGGINKIRHILPVDSTPTASPTGRFARVRTIDEAPAAPETTSEHQKPPKSSWSLGGRRIPIVADDHTRLSDEDDERRYDSFDDSAKGDTPEKLLHTVPDAHDAFTNHPPPPTHVHVVIVSCKGLRGADFTGYSDPFVEVGAFGAPKHRRFRTKPVRQTLNPSWRTNDARFLVACDDDSSSSDTREPFQGLVFSVFDKDFGRRSQFLGGATIAAKDVPRNGRWMETTLVLQRSHPPGSIAECDTDPGMRAKYLPGFGERREGDDNTDLGVLKVRIAAADDLQDLSGGPMSVMRSLSRIASGMGGRAGALREGRFTHDVAMGLGAAVRHVHVCVVAGKHLVSADENGLSDPYVQVHLDNSPSAECTARRHRTQTQRRTLNPVWGEGNGETFTFRRAPGAAEVQLRVWDADAVTRHQFLGVATVPLADAPQDGSWSDNLVLSLFPDGPSQEAEHSGQCMGHLVVRVSASSPLPKGWPSLLPNLIEESELNCAQPRLEFWEDSKEPPPAPVTGPYVNKVTSSTFVYFQICGTRDLPTYRQGPDETTNVKATVALNSDRHVHHTAVQAEVSKDAVWIPEVCSFPKNPNSSTVTVRVYGNLTKLWDPTVMTDMARDVTMGVVDRGSGGDANDAKSSRYSQSKLKGRGSRAPTSLWSRWGSSFGPDLNKKHFALGTLVGEVKIPVAGLTPGGTAEPRWLPIAPVRSDKDKVPSWLAPYGDRLGEVCIASSAGFLREAPEDLVNPSDHWVLPALGELEVRVLEVVGDAPPKDIASSWFGWTGTSSKKDAADHNVDDVDNRDVDNNLLGADVSVQLLWEGRAEKVATPHEHRSFGVTDPSSELRVLVLAEGPLAMDEVLLGAAMLPVRDVIEALGSEDGGKVDAWLDVISPHRETRSSDMADVNFRMRAARKKRPRGWRGRVRVSVKLVPKRAMHRWYLRQVARPRGEAYVDDTFKGVVASVERLCSALLSPITAPLAAMAHTLSGASPDVNNAWIVWHTSLCLCARAQILWAFFPLWYASGMCFVGYVSALAREADDVPGLYAGGRVLRTMSVRSEHRSERANGAPGQLESALSLSASIAVDSPSHVARLLGGSSSTRGFGSSLMSPSKRNKSLRSNPKLLKDPKLLKKKLIEEEERDLEEEERGIFGDESGLQIAEAPTGDVLCATPLKGMGMKVAGNQRESEMELCRLRVQKWLKEHRKIKVKVIRELAHEERLEALRAKGQSTKAALQLIRRADAADGKKKRKKRSRGNQDEDEDADPGDFSSVLLKRMPFAGIVKMFSSTNPAELIVRLLQQLTWTLLLLLKAIGVTLFGSVVSLGKVHRALAGPCRAICAAIDPWNDRLEALGGILSFRDRHLSYYASTTVITLATVWSAILYLGVLPLWHLADTYSPVRLWHVAWIAGIAPCVPSCAGALMKIVVVAERIQQNVLGGLRVQPISLTSIQALERALETEFVAAGGTWEGLEDELRTTMKAQTTEVRERAEKEIALLQREVRFGTGLNPVRWLSHAASRAPTRVDHEHHTLLRRLNVPARPHQLTR